MYSDTRCSPGRAFVCNSSFRWPPNWLFSLPLDTSPPLVFTLVVCEIRGIQFVTGSTYACQNAVRRQQNIGQLLNPRQAWVGNGDSAAQTILGVVCCLRREYHWSWREGSLGPVRPSALLAHPSVRPSTRRSVCSSARLPVCMSARSLVCGVPWFACAGGEGAASVPQSVRRHRLCQ